MNANFVANGKTPHIKNTLQRLPNSILQILRILGICPLRAYFRYFPVSFGKLAIWKLSAAHLWWLETHVTARTIHGSTLRVDASDIVGKHIYYFGKWEPNLTTWISRALKPGDVFIDVGANLGYFSSLASKLVGSSGRVVAIEALPQTFQVLENNLKTNDAHNVRSVNVGAWNKEENVTIFTQAEHPTGTTTLMPDWAGQWKLKTQMEIPAKPLSAILTADEIKKARLIKIDVEGAEWNVINGMEEMLPQCSQNLEIIMEISRSMLATQGKTGEDVLALFQKWGFYVYRVDNDYSAAAYLQGKYRPPARVDKILDGCEDQMDVIFSRTNASFLQ